MIEWRLGLGLGLGSWERTNERRYTRLFLQNMLGFIIYSYYIEETLTLLYIILYYNATLSYDISFFVKPKESKIG